MDVSRISHQSKAETHGIELDLQQQLEDMTGPAEPMNKNSTGKDALR
jgi:hypothetical protein